MELIIIQLLQHGIDCAACNVPCRWLKPGEFPSCKTDTKRSTQNLEVSLIIVFRTQKTTFTSMFWTQLMTFEKAPSAFCEAVKFLLQFASFLAPVIVVLLFTCLHLKLNDTENRVLQILNVDSRGLLV